MVFGSQRSVVHGLRTRKEAEERNGVLHTPQRTCGHSRHALQPLLFFRLLFFFGGRWSVVGGRGRFHVSRFTLFGSRFSVLCSLFFVLCSLFFVLGRRLSRITLHVSRFTYGSKAELFVM